MTRSTTLTTILAVVMARPRTLGAEAGSAGINGGDAPLYYGFVRKSQRLMRILMIAPEPFFEPRGTPFSEFHRIRALTTLGHQIDLVTYPFGANVSMRGLRIFRSMRPPFIRAVKIGPSWAKAPLDVLLATAALRRAMLGRYDAVHSHEEGALLGVLLAWLLRVPHLYDMHSSLPQQLTNFDFSGSSLLRRLFEWVERVMVRRSKVVVVICPALEDTVRAVDPHAQVVLIENAPGSSDVPPTVDDAEALRRQYGFDRSIKVVLYTGTFEAYQGLDLLFDVRLLLAGGKADQVDRARERARGSGVEGTTVFAGERPPAEIPAYLLACDVLVSPRSRGTNTPLKIYQYLRAGKPIVATRLPTHTQVLSDETAVLTGASPRQFAEGILLAIEDHARGQEIGRRARELADTKYSDEAYLERTKRACLALTRGAAPLAAVKDLA
jgi:glycosyltransferase involved in cell wall biosynthesis